MSKTIDEKVVEMRFDNKNFESNVRTSMSTLDKLKSKLNLTSASKGLENVSRAAKNVNMNGLASGIETVHAKFSAMEVIGVTALANISNAAVNAGKNMIASLSGMQAASSGFNEYSMTMNTVQTLVNSTGKSVKEVEKQLKELDTYADKTVYSTADMFNNIYKFTNAGIDLETAKTAMIGIANATAYAGQGAQQASIAYYNLAQSMSMGYLTTIDYKSLNLANVATKEFKERMAETAVQEKILTKTTDGLYHIGNKTYTLQQLFTQGLSDQWATTDVMMKVFKEYGSQETAIGKKAWAAAQEVKTFGMMMESLKAQAGTGWKDTWQILFGGLDDAKRMWTGLSMFIGNIINGVDRWRNTILEIAFNNPLSYLLDMINNNPAVKTFEELTDKVKNTTKTLEEYQEMVTKIWRGDYKNQPYRKALVEQAGYNYEVTQSLVNLTDEIAGYGKGWQVIGQITEEDVISAEKKYGIYADQTTETVKQQKKAVQELTDERLKEIGLNDDEIYMYRQLEKGAKKYGMSIEELAKKMDQASGRDLLYGSADGKVVGAFQHIGNALSNIFNAIKKGWTDVFEGITGVDLYFLIEKFNKLTESLDNAFDPSKSDRVRKLSETFRGLFSIIHILTSLIGGGFKLAFQILKGILGAFNIEILDFTSFIGNLIYSFDRWLTQNNIIAETVKKIVIWLKDAVIAVKDWIVQNERLMSIIGTVKDAIVSFGGSIKDWAKNVFEGAKESKNIPKYIFQGLINGIKSGAPKVFEVIKTVATGLIEAIKNVLGIHSPSKVMIAIGGFIIAGLVQGLATGSTDIFNVLKKIGNGITEFFKNINLGTLIAVGMTSGLLILANKLLNIVGVLVNVLSSVTNLMNSISTMFYNIGGAVKDLGKSFKRQGTAAIINSMTMALAVIVASIVILANMDKDKLQQGVKMVGHIMVAYGAVVAVILFLSQKAKEVNAFDLKSIIGITVGLSLVLSAVTKSITKLASIKFAEGNSLEKTLVLFAAAIAGLVVLLVALAGVAKIYAENANLKDNVNQMVKLVLSASVGMLLIAKSLQMVNGMKFKDTEVLFAALTILIGALVGIALINKSGALTQAADTIKNVGLTLLLLVVAMKLSGSLKPKDFRNGVKVVGVFGLLLLEMALISKLLGTTELVKVSASILAVTGSIILLAIAAKICRKNKRRRFN